ncbi:hypothetical protein GQ55_9G227900 [Panicum hallii var. hallii]|uniref:No apical meristem-associated C-terminal domain-containing protein n=1 Tax=Panicum hallii var. hallii TaxID=1504633 RepID=A0A2T7C684_9POAL|nr:hypothetical protein GQ55_9G227900 [Panicum hallii var. hallii]
MDSLSPRRIRPQSNGQHPDLPPSTRKRALCRGRSRSYGLVVRRSTVQDTAVAAVGSKGPRMENPYDGNDAWAYNLVANIDQQIPSQGDFDIASPPVIPVEEQTEIQPPVIGVEKLTATVPRSKRAKGKNVSRRGGGFTKEEDAIICSAFLNVSKDPITGVNQSSGGYYKRMHMYYEAHKPQGSNRSQLAVQGRWGTIQKALNKFCGIKSAIDRRNESGKNEQDRIDDAVKVFEEKEPFSFMHCWRILRDEPKWNDRVLELNNTTPSGGGQQKGSPMQGETGNVDPARPDGRDKAKKMKAKAPMLDASSSSTAVEVLHMMTSSRETRIEKQDSQMAEILSRKDEKIRIQKEMLENQKREIEMRQKQHEDTLLATQKNQEIRLMESEAQLLNAEAGIMCIDIDKLAPHIRAYYTGMQKRIMERRGFGSPSD